MAYQHKEGQGNIFPNSKTSDNQPDMKDTVNIGGKDYDVAAWNKQGAKGSFMSLSVKLKGARPANNKQPALDVPEDIDMPF